MKFELNAGLLGFGTVMGSAIASFNETNAAWAVILVVGMIMTLGEIGRESRLEKLAQAAKKGGMN